MKKIQLILFLIPLFSQSQTKELVNKKYIIKTEPMNIFFNHSSLGFEKLLDNHKSVNLVVGFIGIRKQPSYEIIVNGGYSRLGFKFYLSKKTYPKGFYNNPELCFGYIGNKYSVRVPNPNYTKYEDKDYFLEKYIFGFINNFGYQSSLIKNRLLFDVYIGIGSTFDNEIDSPNYYYSESSFFVEKLAYRNRLTGNMGFNLAYIFGKK